MRNSFVSIFFTMNLKNSSTFRIAQIAARNYVLLQNANGDRHQKWQVEKWSTHEEFHFQLICLVELRSHYTNWRLIQFQMPTHYIPFGWLRMRSKDKKCLSLLLMSSITLGSAERYDLRKFNIGALVTLLLNRLARILTCVAPRCIFAMCKHFKAIDLDFANFFCKSNVSDPERILGFI